MRLIDIDEIGVMPIDITDLPYDECLMTYLKEDIDNAPTVKAIPIERLEQIMAEITAEVLSHSGTGEEVIQAYVDGLNYSLNNIDKAIKEQNE